MKKLFAAAALAGALAMPMAATTEAQPQVVVGGGLVNVQIVDAVDLTNVLTDINVAVGVAANIVANVCDTTVNAVAVQLAQGDVVRCSGDIDGAPVNVTAGD